MRDFQKALSGLRNQRDALIILEKKPHKSINMVDYTQVDLEGKYDVDDELTIDENINPIEIDEDKIEDNHEEEATTDKNDSFDNIRISHTPEELIISEGDQKLVDSIEISSNGDKNTNDDHKEDEKYSKIFFYIVLFFIFVILLRGFTSN